MEGFYDIIGYTFKNSSLISEALTHSSYANESHKDIKWPNQKT